MDQQPPFQRRRFGRRAVCHFGWIKSKGRPELPCVVRDLSVQGARLDLERPFELPFHFIVRMDSIGFESWATLRHQRGCIVGVEFLNEDPTQTRVPIQEKTNTGIEVAKRMRREAPPGLLNPYRRITVPFRR